MRFILGHAFNKNSYWWEKNINKAERIDILVKSIW